MVALPTRVGCEPIEPTCVGKSRRMECLAVRLPDKGRGLVLNLGCALLSALCALLPVQLASLAASLLCSSQSVMEEFDLGPNGAMVYCLEYLEKNVDWLMERLEGLNKKYLIFDFPGQV